MAGVITRPFRWPQAIWAVVGAASLILFGLLPVGAAVRAVGKGAEVYLFLTGMMLSSEVARREGLFDWLAAADVNRARESQARLFALIYMAGVVLKRTGVVAFLARELARAAVAAALGHRRWRRYDPGDRVQPPQQFAGLIASTPAGRAQPPGLVNRRTADRGDLGPTLSIAGSLATILWLVAIRREEQVVRFRRFLEISALVMPPPLLAALAARLFVG